MSARKTLKRDTAEALFAFAKQHAPRIYGDGGVEAAALFAQVEYELHGGLKPKAQYDFEFEKLWKMVPASRRLGTKYESNKLYVNLRKSLTDSGEWPGDEAVLRAYYNYLLSVRDGHRGGFAGDEWEQFVALLPTWLRQRRFLG